MYPMLFFVRTADHFFFYVLLSFLTLMFFVAFGMVGGSVSLPRGGNMGEGQDCERHPRVIQWGPEQMTGFKTCSAPWC